MAQVVIVSCMCGGCFGGGWLFRALYVKSHQYMMLKRLIAWQKQIEAER